MANTITANLEKLLAGSIPLLEPAAPRVPSFCTLLPMDTVEIGKTTLVPVVTTAQAVIENPTSFESSGDTLDTASATQVHLSAQFGFTAADAAKGLELRVTLATHLLAMQKAIQAKIFALFTAANYGDAVAVSASSFAKANLQTLLAAVPNRTATVLDTGHWVKAERDWFPPGAETTLAECSTWTGAETNTAGFVARPEAVALAYGYPTVGPRDIQSRKITLPIGLDVQFSQWFQRSGRAWRGSLDIVIAPEVGQSGALRLLKSA